MYVSYFIIISPWKWACFFILRDLNAPCPRMLWAQFGWTWASGSWEQCFLNVANVYLLFFFFFIIFSPWIRAWSFIWWYLNSLHPRILCARFGWNTQVPRYLLFCGEGIVNAHALTLVGIKLTPYIGCTCICCFKFYFVHFTSQ